MAWWNRKRRGQKAGVTPDGLPFVTMPPDILNTLRLYGLRGSYGALYRSQPNIRSVVDFLADEVQSVKLHLYERVPSSVELPDGRLEQADHPMMRVLNRPGGGVTTSQAQTRARLWISTVSDMCIYDIAIWRKVRASKTGPVGAVVRIPVASLIPQRDPQTYQLTHYTTVLGERLELSDLVIFQGYDPEYYQWQTSPLETLRRILAEEFAAGQNREGVWRNATRKDGLVRRPLEAPQWSPEAREAWRADWEAIMSGDGSAGRTGILEDGMEWIDAAWSPREMEYLGARALTRKECAAAFRVDPALVFATDRAITADIRTAFYVDRLVPLLTRLQEDVDLQLLPEFEPFDAQRRVYTEFNIDAKLRGSFEEFARVGSSAVGGPVVTVNEWRGRLNLPAIDGGDQIFVPLNSVRGGGPQGSPQAPVQTPGVQPAGTTPGGGTQSPVAAQTQKDIGWAIALGFTPEQAVWLAGVTAKSGETVASDPAPEVKSEPEPEPAPAPEPAPVPKRQTKAKIAADDMRQFIDRLSTSHGKELAAFFERQRRSLKSKKSSGFDRKRWDRELGEDLLKQSMETVGFIGKMAAQKIGGTFDLQRTRAYWADAASANAESINQAHELDLATKPVDEVFDAAAASADNTARTRENRVANWTVGEVARQNSG